MNVVDVKQIIMTIFFGLPLEKCLFVTLIIGGLFIGAEFVVTKQRWETELWRIIAGWALDAGLILVVVLIMAIMAIGSTHQ